MRARSHGVVALAIVALLIAACAGGTGSTPGWTLGPTGSLAPAEQTTIGSSPAAASPTSAATADPPRPSTATASPAASSTPRPNPTRDDRPALRYPDVESHGTVTIAFSRPATLPAIELHLECEWISPTEVGYFYAWASPVSLAGEAVTFYFEPHSPGGYGFRIERHGAASYSPGRRSGFVGLDSVGPGWASGVLRFDLGVDPSQEPGPLTMPIERWTRPIGDDPALRWLAGTVTWACEPAPPTVPEPGPAESYDPGPTAPPLPRLTLVADDLRRDAVSGCGGFIDIGGYTAADSCGPSYQALGVDYIVRIRAGGRLRFVLPEGWRFDRWSFGWVSQVEAERWHGEEPEDFEVIRQGGPTDGRVLELRAPPAGDWSVRLDWTGARGEDRFAAPDYFRVLVE